MLSRVEKLEQLCFEMRTLSRSEQRRQVEAEGERILASRHFRSSQRSRKFLTYVLERALAGDFDALKERVLGVELYQRDSLFDTEQDSIVRVAANDVRKRLHDYYQENSNSPIQIVIPTGVYIPRVDFLPAAPAPSAIAAAAPLVKPGRRPMPWLAVVVLGTLVLTAALSIRRSEGLTGPRVVNSPVWSNVLKQRHPVTIAVADANLVMSKVHSSRDVPVGVYASHDFRYVPDLKGEFGEYLNNVPLTTASDAVLASRIVALCIRGGVELSVKHSNRLDSSALKGSDPIILLGSSTSNPWARLLDDRINFRMAHDFDTGVETCINSSPRPGELAKYVPKRDPLGISEGYALIALTQNLSGAAPVLMIAGTNTEGTEAAGEFVTNLDKLTAALGKLGIKGSNNVQHLELLIRTRFVPAASVNAEIVASRVR